VNPKCFVFGHEHIHVHGRSNSSATNGSANGFGMIHQAVEVGGAEPRRRGTYKRLKQSGDCNGRTATS
jgi:hypothetical protein